MSYFKKKLNPVDNITDYLLAFQFKKYKVNIKGSSILLVNKYFGDYDLYTYVGDFHRYTTHVINTHSDDELFDEFTKILNNVDDIENSYFVEFKIGDKNGNYEIIKHRDNFTRTKFKNLLKKYELSFIQIEYINYIGERFITMTSDYFFYKPPSYSKILEDLKTAIKKLLENKSYYKVLKRMFNIYQLKAEHNKEYEKEHVKYIVDFFNSKIGADVVKESNLKAILKLREQYPRNNNVLKLTKLNLMKLHYKPTLTLSEIRKDINVLNTTINNESKKIFIDVL